MIAFLKGVKGDDRRLALGAVLALSLACVVGLYSSISVAERQLLTPPVLRVPASTGDPIAGRKYLRSTELSKIAAIDQQVRSGLTTKEAAYDELVEIVR